MALLRMIELAAAEIPRAMSFWILSPVVLCWFNWLC